ncbi:MAG: sn-glycerol-3-phosphate ABC transporter ATP-binding protein UgpC [Desulfobacterales bacterium]|nr:sn-glycerol-3-phosphate ABC transporter ATP-binding protein UgpC [Deltaproteobacteria bacterium]NNL77385.1 sn-glycerol-3-phosphate ABC transporter ATP-binding protein UgpC [Desulfobacterales bacterium]
MANVILRNVTKRFDAVVAVDNINLEVADREFLVLVGPSGCGKTTTLRMIAGLEEITEGEIFIGDQLVNNLEAKDRNIAMVFQSYALYPHMKVFDNMAFGLKMRKVPKEEREVRVRKAANILGIEDLLQRKPKQLSGGQRQRVALGRAIVRDPLVFLFDEPLSNLDAKLRVQMRTELKKLHERLQATAIYVTHDQVEAMTMGNRIVVMKDGIVQQVGRPLEIYKNPSNRFVAGFIGSPAMNFIECHLLEENSNLYINTEDFKIPLSDSLAEKLRPLRETEFIFGIRPEDFREKGHGPKIATQEITIKANVIVIEPVGKEISLNISTGTHSLTVVLNADAKATLHADIELALNMDKIHLFRREGGEAIF